MSLQHWRSEIMYRVWKNVCSSSLNRPSSSWLVICYGLCSVWPVCIVTGSKNFTLSQHAALKTTVSFVFCSLFAFSFYQHQTAAYQFTFLPIHILLIEGFYFFERYSLYFGALKYHSYGWGFSSFKYLQSPIKLILSGKDEYSLFYTAMGHCM